MACFSVERRLQTLEEVAESSDYSPGIARIEQMAEQEFEKHDLSFQPLDPLVWQVNYTLLNHHIRVSNVAEKMAQRMGYTQREVQIVRVSGRLHDTGKLDDICRAYRFMRTLTVDEKAIVDLHPVFSDRFVQRLQNLIRLEDMPFFDEVSPVIRFHHRPYMIAMPRLRTFAYILMAADVFVSLQEDRWRPGLGQFEAVEAARQFADLWPRNDDRHGRHVVVIGICGEIIKELYGSNFE